MGFLKRRRTGVSRAVLADLEYRASSAEHEAFVERTYSHRLAAEAERGLALIAELRGDIESLTNALDARGRTIDFLAAERKEARELAAFWQVAWLAGIQGEQKAVEQ
jgi:hypothetical protein